MSSRQPQSAANREWDARARAGAPASEPVKKPAPPPPRPKRFRVRVEPPSADRILSKYLYTTQRLTAEELRLVRSRSLGQPRVVEVEAPPKEGDR
jgi:hypothetical protein